MKDLHLKFKCVRENDGQNDGMRMSRVGKDLRFEFILGKDSNSSVGFGDEVTGTRTWFKTGRGRQYVTIDASPDVMKEMSEFIESSRLELMRGDDR